MKIVQIVHDVIYTMQCNCSTSYLAFHQEKEQQIIIQDDLINLTLSGKSKNEVINEIINKLTDLKDI